MNIWQSDSLVPGGVDPQVGNCDGETAQIAIPINWTCAIFTVEFHTIYKPQKINVNGYFKGLVVLIFSKGWKVKEPI